MKPVAWLCMVVAVTVTSATCQRSPEKISASSDPNEPILAVIRAQTDALNKENLDETLAVIDASSPGFEQTKQLSEQLFRTYDLRYTLENLVVESVGADEATVRFTQMTEKISGPDFRNNRIEGVHTLKKQPDGQWRLYMTRADKIDYLDK